jgi:hypothetical protein
MSEEPKVKRRIVCAAIRAKADFVLALGARHFDLSMKKHIKQIDASFITGVDEDDFRFGDQGFIDQFGVFVDRKEAWIIAKEAEQIIKRVGGNESSELYSENLY